MRNRSEQVPNRYGTIKVMEQSNKERIQIMYQIDYSQPVHVHFCGIGGISMSGLAFVLLGRGFTVTGSDSRQSDLTRQLEQKGAVISYPQSAQNITKDIDVMVCTAAIHPDNPEYAAAISMGIPILTRAQLLGQIMDHYTESVAVSGTHGKTTVTSMLSCILLSADVDPTISVGGILKEIGGNIRVGHSSHFITEACEYTNSFLSLKPKYGLILNIDADHLDFFKDLEDIRRSFHRFAQNILPGGVLIMNSGIPHPEEITDGINAKVITYGEDIADYVPFDVSYDDTGSGTFHVRHDGRDLGAFTLHVPGAHNVSNAVCAIAAADQMGISMEDCRKGLDAFHGADRRFQVKGKLKNGATVIDDYAHHPTEIRATLEAARNYPHKKIWCVFQPHTYTRTKALMDEFAGALCQADEVVLAPIYAARETDTLGISSDTLRQQIAGLGTSARYFPDFDQIEAFLLSHVREGDLIITTGAGDIVRVGEALLEKER
jgi:UDP-N-acetylmuramate--alanine ligase